MGWNVEYTDEFGVWWNRLSEDQQEDFTAIVELLMVQTYPFWSLSLFAVPIVANMG